MDVLETSQAIHTPAEFKSEPYNPFEESDEEMMNEDGIEGIEIVDIDFEY